MTGDGFVETFAWETEAGYAVHVLNYTNPAAFHGWLDSTYPLREQKVELQLPPGTKVTRVELLRAGHDIPYQVKADHISFTIPRVADYEVAGLYVS